MSETVARCHYCGRELNTSNALEYESASGWLYCIGHAQAVGEVEALRAENDRLRRGYKEQSLAWDSTPAENARLRGEVEKLWEALRMVRTLIKDSGGVPRYTVTPGAALNSFVEETLDPLLKDAT